MKNLCRITALVISMLLFAPSVMAQFVSDIYLARVFGHDPILIGWPKDITCRPGYDNQPAFLLDGSGVVYSSERIVGDVAQTDIYKYVLDSRQTVQLTDTSINEFSPAMTPDGAYLSTIRAEDPEFSVIRLWRFNLDGSDPQLLLAEPALVGYYGWYDKKTALIFAMFAESTGMSFQMHLANLENGDTQFLVENPGRCFRRIPNEESMSFVHKESADRWYIKKINMNELDDVEVIVQTLEGSEDFAWTPNGVLLAAQGRSIYKFDPARDDSWQKVRTFYRLGSDKEIQRIALNPAGNMMAFVVFHGCRIGWRTYQSGENNPDNPCQVCDPAVSNRSWTDQADQSNCDDGLYCNGEDTCQAGICQHSGNPCEDGLICDEQTDICLIDDGEDDDI